MENQTSFDLNLAVQKWRENLAQSPALQIENLNELESHLRDSIATLQAMGLSGQEAFVIASGRIGKAQQLENEFAKVNANSVWHDRLLWMLIGIQAWMAITVFSSTVTFFVSQAASRASLDHGYYSDAQRKWIAPNGPGATAIFLEILGFLTPSLVLALVAIVAWKILLKSKQNKRDLMDQWLAKPIRLGVFLFVVCFGFQFAVGSLREFGMHQLHWWQILLMRGVYAAPPCFIGSMLIAILARKRLGLRLEVTPITP